MEIMEILERRIDKLEEKQERNSAKYEERFIEITEKIDKIYYGLMKVFITMVVNISLILVDIVFRKGF